MRAWMGIALAATMLAASGCGNAGEYCEERIECLDGNDADEEACVQQFDADEEFAAIYGCDEQWAQFSDCVVEKSSCIDGDYTTRDSATHDDQCDAKEDNLVQCIRGASTIDD